MKQCKGYDERQILERGNAFRNAYITLAAALLICFFIKDSGWNWADDFSQMLICLWSSILVCSIQMILKNAYDGIYEGRMRGVVTALGIIGAILLVRMIWDMAVDPFATRHDIGLVAGALSMLTLGIVYWIKLLRDRKRERCENKA